MVHARLGHIPFKRYEQLLTMAEGVPPVTDGIKSDDVCKFQSYFNSGATSRDSPIMFST
ncbi:hypothetical protein F442_09657 [Phytophthora nicotianae P10297]|uniref:GAG-pre-integrase domain-containing protein n=1 Tax=Phytophthora nicotianae P10297 TaxID=1317064 RepID=W2Z8E1_PHYNI|nr:hypothetical protein F442_09657 [Phytophthora nicotianae P10297]